LTPDCVQFKERNDTLSKINTVLGPIDSSAPGYTRVHEHLLWKWPGIELDPLVEFDEEEDFKSVK
jgi:predicted metal-dependent phosphotriesterase family hydrolase